MLLHYLQKTTIDLHLSHMNNFYPPEVCKKFIKFQWAWRMSGFRFKNFLFSDSEAEIYNFEKEFTWIS
jgi:anti-sigma factor ChrR (cupin superfamily)